MRKITTILSVVLLTFCLSLSTAFAQSPEKMSYQAVVRDASNTLVTSTNVGMQVSILQGSVVGAPVYTEIHTVATNLNGLVSLEIGTGTIISGNFAAINWTNGPYFIKTETDPTGGTNYTITGINQLLSVPYALHAKTADNAINDLVDDADSDSSNELQTLSINLTNDTVFLSDGGFIYLSPALGDNWGSESVNTLGVNITGNGTVANPLVVIDNDTSASNEIELPGTANTNEMLMWNGTAWVAADVCSLFTFFYADTDGDGFGNPFNTVFACIQPTGFVTDNTDCNDGDANAHPGAIEVCDGIDNNCNGVVDEGVSMITQYIDNDGDGYGDAFDPGELVCVLQNGFSLNNGDCHDGDLNTNPGAAEVCADGIDNNCNGVTDEVSCNCPPGFADCDNNGSCETNLLSDPNNCAGCGNVCPPGRTCVNGVCVII